MIALHAGRRKPGGKSEGQWRSSLAAYTQRGSDQPRGGRLVDRPAHDPAAEHVEDDRAVDLALSCWVLGVGVGPGRPVSFSAGGFPRPALRTGRATSTASGSPCVHARCCLPNGAASFASHVPAAQPQRGRATAPVFTSDLRDQHVCCEHTGPLRHVTGFPDLGLLRVLRPTPPVSAGNKPSRRPAGCWPVREPGGWFPRSLSNRSTGSASSYAPATSPRLRRRHSPWPPDRRHRPAKEFPTQHCCASTRCCAAPDPPGSSRWVT